MYIPQKRLKKRTTVLKQVARGPIWLQLILSAFIAGFAVLFVPGAHTVLLAWFLGLAALAFCLLRLTFGFRSWIVQEKNAKYTLCIRDNHSRTTIQLPIDYITMVDHCEYTGFRKNESEINYLYNSCHKSFKHWGYLGPGLEISFQLPRTSAGSVELRSWRIPSPKAEAFYTLIAENMVDRRHLLHN
ncbi:hypothetical protein [Halioxenophilus aromaticivorans]|uniref:DUF58 domain-containing protein n=1 Tax=Halioxenophilus aromaticivorans TaxID=1306992 RepID=A0AAV3TWW3_9ALTE